MLANIVGANSVALDIGITPFPDLQFLNAYTEETQVMITKVTSSSNDF